MPLLAALAALGAAAVVPFSPMRSRPDVGVLYVLAVGGDRAADLRGQGWSSNSWPSFGGMRAVAQFPPRGAAAALGDGADHPLRLDAIRAIAQAQADHHWFVVWPFFIGIPRRSASSSWRCAEANRILFDIPEAES